MALEDRWAWGCSCCPLKHRQSACTLDCLWLGPRLPDAGISPFPSQLDAAWLAAAASGLLACWLLASFFWISLAEIFASPNFGPLAEACTLAGSLIVYVAHVCPACW
ncbi:hypothetical protein BJ166DRAFT_496628 [Pestalotiopsis sp. NC0098]|nr:hypothetical protein BJ166DRAFT_496628 [Pestalotiopsis sp. NC0098]